MKQHRRRKGDQRTSKNFLNGCGSKIPGNTGYPKNPMGKRKNKPKPVVPRAFLFDPRPNTCAVLEPWRKKQNLTSKAKTLRLETKQMKTKQAKQRNIQMNETNLSSNQLFQEITKHEGNNTKHNTTKPKNITN